MLMKLVRYVGFYLGVSLLAAGLMLLEFWSDRPTSAIGWTLFCVAAVAVAIAAEAIRKRYFPLIRSRGLLKTKRRLANSRGRASDTTGSR
jgi:hypothetical protein